MKSCKHVPRNNVMNQQQLEEHYQKFKLEKEQFIKEYRIFSEEKEKFAGQLEKIKKEALDINEEKKQIQAQREQISKESQEINERRKSLPMSSKTIGSLKEYSFKEDWSGWIERLDQYVLVNEIHKNKIVPLLITLLGNEEYVLLRNLCSPAKPSSKTYVELVQIMSNHLKPKPNLISERCKFNDCRQEDNEDIKSYFTRLKKMSEYCDFGANLNTYLRDKLCWGVRNRAIKERLMEENDLTCERAYGLATSMETAARDADSMGSNKSTTSPADTRMDVCFFKNKSHRKTNPGNKNNTNANKEKIQKCFRCGKTNHLSLKCRFIDAKCHKCGNVGHIAPACKTKKVNIYGNSNSKSSYTQNTKNHNYVDELEDLSENLDRLFHIRSETVSENKLKDLNRPKTQLLINNENFTFEIDTGSPISAISRELYQNNKKTFSVLQPTNKVFASFHGDLMVPIGVVEVNVTFREINKNLQLYILGGNNLPIIGLQWLKALKIMEHTNEGILLKINNITSSGSNITNSFFQEFESLFSEGIGKYKQGTFKLKLKEEAKPIFHKPRPVPYALKDKVSLELDRLVSEGIIIPVESSDWATPIVPVLKRNGDIRICGDHKITINKFLKIDRYPIPRIQDLLSTIN